MKIIFAGTPEFAVAPFNAIASEHQIVAVLTQPDRKAGRGKKLTASAVKNAALEIGVPVFQPSDLKDQAELIRSFKADIMVVVAYGMLLPQQILDIPPLGCLNIHASLLPRWRGAAPIQRAIEAGDACTGVCIMKMEIGLDTGPVYESFSLDIMQSDTSETLHDRLASLGALGICKTLRRLENKPLLLPTPQDASNATYARKISKAEADIDWNKTAKQIDQQIRAFIPWPVSQTRHLGTRLRVWQAQVIDSSHCANPGTILGVSAQGVDVACAVGVIRLEKLQRDGSKAMHYSEFCNGYQLASGELLGDSNDAAHTPIETRHTNG